MKFSFDELSAEGGSFSGSCGFDEDGFRVEVNEYQADFVPTDAGLYLNLRVEYSYKAPCDRCLEETGGSGKERADIQLVSKAGSFKDEEELGDDDMGIMYIEEDEIDLDAIIRQEVGLLLPVRILCGEDCKGLCHKCGENLNSGSCKCEADADPRWSTLKNIKK